ncbi:hypothetical protein AYI69_g3673 [Smittium culicis]|uniref:Uncharacterized protein n=1 Tax=Smittium culicis TaxID=133412 RepID=A0A1R1YJ51_9FUNG|nr:hypothetical protein AYI69_g3673 [Smittium culicis]
MFVHPVSQCPSSGFGDSLHVVLPLGCQTLGPKPENIHCLAVFDGVKRFCGIEPVDPNVDDFYIGFGSTELFWKKVCVYP